MKVTAGSEEVAIEVLDQGAGIDAAVANKLFEPHVTSKAHGAGMGLYITRRIARSRYAGEVTLSNTERGTLATLTLNRQRSLPA